MLKEKIDEFAWREYEDVIVRQETTYNITNLQSQIDQLQTEYDAIDQRKIDLLSQLNSLKAKKDEGLALIAPPV